jgi:hypothetical protein
MPVLELELPFWITYSGYTISCVVNNIPAGVTIISGRSVLKRKKDDLDDNALVTKDITTFLDPSMGQITSIGTNGQGSAIFIFTGADTAMADPANQARYEIAIKFYFSTGEPLTFAQCYIKPIQGVVQALV